METILSVLSHILIVVAMVSMTVTVLVMLFQFWFLNKNKLEDSVIELMVTQLTWKWVAIYMPVTILCVIGIGALVQHYTTWLSFYTPVACLYMASVITFCIWAFNEKRELKSRQATSS